MDDTISRQAAIKAADSIIERDTSGNNDVVKAMNAWKEYIKGLPSAQQGWIPCTPDTMPKMTDIYLVKVRINQYGEGMYPTFRTALWHTASRKWFVHESENSIIGEVTEWMPIPWKGGQDGKN